MKWAPNIRSSFHFNPVQNMTWYDLAYGFLDQVWENDWADFGHTTIFAAVADVDVTILLWWANEKEEEEKREVNSNSKSLEWWQKELMHVTLTHTHKKVVFASTEERPETKRTFGLANECLRAFDSSGSRYNRECWSYEDIVLLPNITITSAAHQLNNKRPNEHEPIERQQQHRKCVRSIFFAQDFYQLLLKYNFSMHECRGKKRNTFPLNMWGDWTWNWRTTIVANKAAQHSTAHRPEEEERSATATQPKSTERSKQKTTTKMKMCSQHSLRMRTYFLLGVDDDDGGCDDATCRFEKDTCTRFGVSLSLSRSFGLSHVLPNAHNLQKNTSTHILLSLIFIIVVVVAFFSFRWVHLFFSWMWIVPVVLSVSFIHSKMCFHVYFCCYFVFGRKYSFLCFKKTDEPYTLHMHCVCMRENACVYECIGIISFKKPFNSRS